MAAVTAALVGAAAALGTAGYTIASGISDRKEAKENMKTQQDKQASLEAEAKKKADEQEMLTTASKTQAQARQRQRQLAGASAGRAGTIQTSPLGIQGSVPSTPYQGKTLLGA